MDVRWQDEVKRLYNLVYYPEKEKLARNKKVELGFSHWWAYLSKYAELRREEKRLGNSLDIVEARMKRLHPIAWSWATNWYYNQ